jgi:hypothetical protein
VTPERGQRCDPEMWGGDHDGRFNRSSMETRRSTSPSS